MNAINALNIYYSYWGKDEIKAQRQLDGVKQLKNKLTSLYTDPIILEDWLEGDWIDREESIELMKDMSRKMLNETEYNRRTMKGRIAKNLNLPTPYLIYKLRIQTDMLRGVDSIVALM